MKVKFVTAIYNNLYGTEFGGRPERSYHYKYSLLSLLKMTQAKFIMYTSPEEYPQLLTFFYDDHNITADHLEIKTFSLKDCKEHNIISSKKQQLKNLAEDRCYELQYSKFEWLKREIDPEFSHIFWIDAGLSHVGLLPEKYFITDNNITKYFTYDLFNNNFLNNLINKIEDKIFIIGKDNTGINFWSKSLPSKFYNNYNADIHVIGGLFGGKLEKVREYCKNFTDLLKEVLNEEDLYFEEHLMTALYYNSIKNFSMEYFQIWWYEENGIYPPDHEIYKTNKSFYKIITELQ